MDRAYNKELRIIEYAHHIKNQGENYVNKHSNNYQCPNPYCRYPAETVAFNELKKDGTPFKVPPHFRYKELHAPNCIFHKKFGLKKVINKETGEYSWIMPYVAEIQLPDLESDKSVSLSNQRVSNESNTKSESSSGHCSSSSSTVHSQRLCYISAAAIYYIQDPEEAKDKNLTILNHIGKYQGQFQDILEWNNIGFLDDLVFYKELRYVSPPLFMKDKIIVYLNAIEPHTGERFQLHLNCDQWSEQHKETVKQEIESGINISKQSYYSGKKQHAIAFFIGKQDKEERYVFHCDHAEFCYVYIGERPRLPFNKFGTYPLAVKVQSSLNAVDETLSLRKLENEIEVDDSLTIQHCSIEKLEPALAQFAEQTVDEYFEDAQGNEKLDQIEEKAKKLNSSTEEQASISTSDQIFVNRQIEESSDISKSDKNYELLSNSSTKKKSIFSIIKNFFLNL